MNFTKSLNSATPDILFPSYMDNYGQMPYMYFAPGLPGSSTPNIYNPNHKVTIDGGVTYVSPYYKSLNKYWNPTSFQIISAGRDGVFGNVGQWQDGTSSTDPFPMQPPPLLGWKDNRTNFSAFVLAVPAQ